MITRLKLKPGQRGTKGMLKKYGEALVCVRYRYDEVTHTRYKTVELIEETKAMPIKQPPVSDNMMVPVKIAYGQRDLGKMAKELGGLWNPDKKLWYLQRSKIKGTELEMHMVLDTG